MENKAELVSVRNVLARSIAVTDKAEFGLSREEGITRILVLAPAGSPFLGAFEGDVTACAPPQDGHVVALASPPGKRFDAFAQADIVQKDGSLRPLWVDREPTGKLRVRFGEQTTSIEGAGAQVALGDLDQDGAPEIVTTNDAAAADDFVLVSTWTPQGLRTRAKVPAPAGVRALGVCPPEVRGVPALVAIVGSEVWVWR